MAAWSSSRGGVLAWWILAGCAAAAEGPVTVEAGGVRYEIDRATAAISAVSATGGRALLLPGWIPAGEVWETGAEGDGWRWTKGEVASLTVRPDGPDLSVTLWRSGETPFTAELPVPPPGATWIVPDGEGVAMDAADPFWRGSYADDTCLSATSSLSLPAWGVLSGGGTVSYLLGDGLQSELCLRDDGGLRARLAHRFSPGAERLELLLRVGPANPLAPALAYRELLDRRGLRVPLSAKTVPGVERLYGAPHAYVWGAAREVGFLDRLRALGVERMLLAYDQDARETNPRAGLVGPAYLARATELGFLAGPYEGFENAQDPATADTPTSDWGSALFPAGCILDAAGERVVGFAGRGCELSSEALRRATGEPSPASRYAAHARAGVGHVFVDVDAFGIFHEDWSPAHPMTMARDRENLAARLALGSRELRLLLGSESVRAWSHGVVHYSHGTAQAHADGLWAIQGDRERFGGWWPPERPRHFFQPVVLTADEARAQFGPADQLPLFEAALHDAVVSTDRWEWSFTKVPALARTRFARALLYGTPTMWALDGTEARSVPAWLKAAHDAFLAVHGSGEPVALTGFAWRTPDRLVQEARYADGRVVVANFSGADWDGVGPACVRVTRGSGPGAVVCPPEGGLGP